MLGIDRRQVSVLSDRYLDVVLGDLAGTSLLLVQAPLIAVAVGGVWSNISSDTLSLYFVLCLCAFFVGAVNACREIVKERALFLREKMFNLSVGAYLVSKYRIQFILVVVQCVALTVIVKQFVPLSANVFAVTAVLIAVALTGTAVGLLISSWVSSPDKAVGLVPLVVIPQILFSDFVVGEDKLLNWAGRAQQAMPVYWGYEVLQTVRDSQTDYWTIAAGAGALTAMVAVAFFGALLLLRGRTVLKGVDMKSVAILVLVLVLGGGALWLVSDASSGFSLPSLSIDTAAKQFLTDRTIDFLEDIQFKDFEKASTYHLAEAQKKRDIPSLIRRVFGIRHELLDIVDYKVTEVDFDRSMLRARVRVQVSFRVLGDAKETKDNPDAHRQVILLFYWFKQAAPETSGGDGSPAEGTWTMELESSLR